MRLSPCVLVQPDGWARGEREGYGEPCDVTSLSLSLSTNSTQHAVVEYRSVRQQSKETNGTLTGAKKGIFLIRGLRANLSFG